MVEYLLNNGCETLYLDYKGRTPLHYACILKCDKKIVQLLIDFNKELDKFRAHYKESLDEFKERPIKNFDCVPTANDVIKMLNPHSTTITHHKRKEAFKCVSLAEL